MDLRPGQVGQGYLLISDPKPNSTVAVANLKCFDRITVHGIKAKSKGFQVSYTLEYDGLKKSYTLIQSYREKFEERQLEEVAKLVSLVPVTNYCLFTEEVRFDFPLHELDYKFFTDMSDATARDIFVNRIVERTGLIRDEYVPNPEDVQPDDAKPRAHVDLPETFSGTSLDFETDPSSCIVMTSGGKDSLLTYSLLREIGMRVYPCFFNESGRHWLVALKAYRYFSANIPETRKVWSNLDRLFTFIERNMKIVVPNFLRRSKELYPIRLFWFEHYAFSFLPVAGKYGIGNICFGNEFDDPSNLTFEFKGIKHYYATFDQSQEFEKYVSNWFEQRGINVKQWSPIRPVTGLVVERVLTRRYPEIFKLQMSCHSPILKGGSLAPCGKCSKCTGILLFLLANGIDAALIGYKRRHYLDLPRRILEGKYRLDESELEHSAYLANSIWGLNLPRGVAHPHVETMHFDPVSSHADAIPYCELRERIFDILEPYTLGYTILQNGEWVETTRETVLRLGGCS